MNKIKSNTTTDDVQLDAESVARYLRQNPTFISQHTDLLAHIELAHKCGETVSLIERQALQMRQKIQNDTETLSDILSIARRNDLQFEKTKGLVIKLAGATDLISLTTALKQSFTQEFDAHEMHLALFSPIKETQSHPNLSSVTRLDNNQHCVDIQSLAFKSWAYCQTFEGEAMRSLFPDNDQLKSTAIVPLHLAEKAVGVLIIASTQSNHYNDQLDTLFLNHVASVIASCLGRMQV